MAWAEMGGADLGLTSPGGNLVFIPIAKGSFFEKVFEAGELGSWL